MASTNTATKRRTLDEMSTSPLRAERQETAHREDHGDVGAALLERKTRNEKHVELRNSLQISVRICSNLKSSLLLWKSSPYQCFDIFDSMMEPFFLSPGRHRPTSFEVPITATIVGDQFGSSTNSFRRSEIPRKMRITYKSRLRKT